MPLLQSVLKDEKFRNAAAFSVDFDSHRDFLRAHRVRWQSTLIVFKGAQERGRSVADVEKASIRKLFARGL